MEKRKNILIHSILFFVGNVGHLDVVFVHLQSRFDQTHESADFLVQRMLTALPRGKKNSSISIPLRKQYL